MDYCKVREEMPADMLPMVYYAGDGKKMLAVSI